MLSVINTSLVINSVSLYLLFVMFMSHFSVDLLSFSVFMLSRSHPYYILLTSFCTKTIVFLPFFLTGHAIEVLFHKIVFLFFSCLSNLSCFSIVSIWFISFAIHFLFLFYFFFKLCYFLFPLVYFCSICLIFSSIFLRTIVFV